MYANGKYDFKKPCIFPQTGMSSGQYCFIININEFLSFKLPTEKLSCVQSKANRHHLYRAWNKCALPQVPIKYYHFEMTITSWIVKCIGIVYQQFYSERLNTLKCLKRQCREICMKGYWSSRSRGRMNVPSSLSYVSLNL